MLGWKWLLRAFMLLSLWGCSHGRALIHEVSNDELEEGVWLKCGTLSTRIWALIGQGQFAEAEALIAEGTAAGLLSQQVASRMLDRIALLNTRLGQIPASLQRAPNFPSQLKDFTLFEIKQMLDKKDFSLATRAQLDMVKKLLQDPDRLMQKMGTVR
ncbi:hypothetical protein [Archangium sp.]|uniref:hypothetical protein n=1 Tax=Archangium sp. TaxID=1872627 RepID=UPI002D264F00|nr:hypothetical protein [Archangium sp.]HYO52788.1 hypothetical protein [Archangium sp.]